MGLSEDICRAAHPHRWDLASSPHWPCKGCQDVAPTVAERTRAVEVERDDLRARVAEAADQLEAQNFHYGALVIRAALGDRGAEGADAGAEGAVEGEQGSPRVDVPEAGAVGARGALTAEEFEALDNGMYDDEGRGVDPVGHLAQAAAYLLEARYTRGWQDGLAELRKRLEDK